MQCPVCDNLKNFKFIESFLYYKLYECPECSLVFSEPMKSLFKFYQEKEYYGDRWAFDEFLNEDLEKKGKLLDVGCGEGIFLKKAKGKGFEVYGFDLNPFSIQVAKEKFGLENVYTLNIDDFVNNYPNEKFDVITCFHTLEHMENPLMFIEEIKRIIKPFGFLVLVVPNNKRWYLKYRRPFADYPPNHLTRWNELSLKILLEKFSFSIIKIKEEKFILDNIKKIKEHIKSILSLKFAIGRVYKMKIYSSLKPSKIKKNKILIYNFLAKFKMIFLTVMAYTFIPFYYFLLKNKEFFGDDLYVAAKLR